MAYQYKDDKLKIKSGRPRKYEYEPRPKKKYKPKERDRQQAAEELRGNKIIQLDYFTGEYITEYPSMTALAIDYDIPLGTVLSSFNKTKCCMIRIKKHELLLMRKDDYINMLEGLENVRQQIQA